MAEPCYSGQGKYIKEWNPEVSWEIKYTIKCEREREEKGKQIISTNANKIQLKATKLQ